MADNASVSPNHFEARSLAVEGEAHSSRTHMENSAQAYVDVSELDVKIRQKLKGPVKHNPKLAVFREFVLAMVCSQAKEHEERLSAVSCKTGDGEKMRQYSACDLAAQSGLAGLQWKKHAGPDVHVTLAELRETELLRENVSQNSLSVRTLPLHPDQPAGSPLPHQSPSEVHLAQCEPGVLMLLEAFDFVYLDPHKSPSPYFSTLFRNVRNDGVVCIVVPDTMHFARAPHVVKRCYGANCIKTEYLKELAVRIILSALASEAARCNKGLTVQYAVSLEDFLLLCVKVKRGPKLADAMLLNIGQVLHCRICEERAFYPDLLAPQDAYKLLGCKCHEKVPGKTAVILGPLWKGSLYSWQCLQKIASAGQRLNLSENFFNLLHRVMEDCLCDTPPSLSQLRKTWTVKPDSTAARKNGDASHSQTGQSLSQVKNTQDAKSDDVSLTEKNGADDFQVEHVDGNKGSPFVNSVQQKCGSCGGVSSGQSKCSCNAQSSAASVTMETAENGDQSSADNVTRMTTDTGEKEMDAALAVVAGTDESVTDYVMAAETAVKDAAITDTVSGQKTAEDDNVTEMASSGDINSVTHNGHQKNESVTVQCKTAKSESEATPCGGSITSVSSAAADCSNAISAAETASSNVVSTSATASSDTASTAACINTASAANSIDAIRCSSTGSLNTTRDTVSTSIESKGCKRLRSDFDLDVGDGQCVGGLYKRLKPDGEPSPAPCFYYSVHSKRMGKDHLPKQHAIIERLRANGFRCCRTHFDKYAIRTDADFSTLTTFLGSGESKVIYVKGLESSS